MTGRNDPCPCGSGKRYKHCCGTIPSSNIPLPESAPRKTKRTFVVLGCPRGGTSLLAGALHHAGVYMGDFRTTQYEDPDFKIPPSQAGEAVERLAGIIRQRNETHEYWGWKVPNNIYYIKRIQHLLVNPFFLFVYRDPEQIARSSAKHDQRNWETEGEKLLQVAFNHTAKVRDFQAGLAQPHQVFQLADIHADPVGFATAISGLTRELAPDMERLLDFIDPTGGYH